MTEPAAKIRKFTAHESVNPRQRILRLARGWIGTPYRHGASCKGAGADCLGLVRGVYREFYGFEPEEPPPYSPDWDDVPGPDGGHRELLYQAACRHLMQIPPETRAPGDVLLFRMTPAAPAKHAAILAEPGRMIHALSGRAVMLSFIGSWWRRRIAAVFAFPPRAGAN